MTEHEASAKKKREAREKGNSGISGAATSAAAFLAAVAVCPFAAARAFDRLRLLMREAVASAGERNPASTLDSWAWASELLIITAPVLLAAAAAAAVASAYQSGGVLASKRPFSVNLGAGLRSLVSPMRFVAVLRSLVAAGAVGWVVVRELRAHADDIALSTGQLGAATTVVAAMAWSLLVRVACIVAALGLLDALLSRRQWARKLRMTDDELKRERRDDDGDPEVLQARKRAHQEMLNSASVNAVKGATCLAVNPTHVACALRYDDDADDAPVLLASGTGDLALAMKRAARAYGVPIVKNVPLARALLELPVGEAIPAELYAAVIELLRVVWNEGADRGADNDNELEP